MDRDEILDRTGAETFSQLINEFSGMDIQKIEIQLDSMFVSDDDGELARAIYDEISGAWPMPELVRMTEIDERGTTWTRESYIVDFPNPECFRDHLQQAGQEGTDYIVNDAGIWSSIKCAEKAQEIYERDQE